MEVVSAEVGLHLSDHATAELHKVEAEYKAAMARISRMEAEARIGARTEELDIAIKKAKDNVRMLKGEKAEVALTGDSSDLDEEIAAAEAKVKALDGKKARIDIELRGQKEAARGLEDLTKREAALAAAQARSAKQRESIVSNDARLRQRNAVVTQQERVDVDKLTTAWINQSKVVEKMRRSRGPLIGKEAQAEFAHFQQEADNKLRLIEGRLHSLGARVPPLHMRVDDNFLARAKFAVQDFVNNAQKKLSSINKVRLNLGPFSGTIRTMIIALAGLGPIVTTTIGALTSLAGVLGTGLAGAAAIGGGAMAGLAMNFLGVAAALHPMISDFKIAHAATQKYTKTVLLHGAGSKQAAKAQDQMNRSLAGVDPLAADAAQGMSKLSIHWGKLTKDATRQNVGMAMGAGFKTLNSILPVVAKNTNNTTAIVATSFTHMMQSIRKNSGQKGGGILGSLGRSANVFLAPALRGLEHLGAALARIGESAARIFAGPAGNGFLKWAQHFDKSTQNSDKLDANIRRLGHHATDLLHLFGAVGRLITTVFNGGADSGDNMVKSMTHALNRWNDFLKSPAGHEKMATFFDKAEHGARALWSAIGPLVASFAKWSIMLQPFTSGLLKGIGFVAKLVGGLIHLGGMKQSLAALGVTLGLAFGVSKIAGFLGMIIRIVKLMKEAALLAKSGRIVDAFKSLGGIGGAIRGKGAGVAGQIETAGAAAGREMATAIEGAGTAVASEIRTAMGTGGTVAAEEIAAGEAAGGRVAAAEIAAGGAGAGAIGAGGAAAGGALLGRIKGGLKTAGLFAVGAFMASEAWKGFADMFGGKELKHYMDKGLLDQLTGGLFHPDAAGGPGDSVKDSPSLRKAEAAIDKAFGGAKGRKLAGEFTMGFDTAFKSLRSGKVVLDDKALARATATFDRIERTTRGKRFVATLAIQLKGNQYAQEQIAKLASTKLGSKFLQIISKGGPEAAKWLAYISQTKLGGKLFDIISRGGPGAHRLLRELSDKKIRNKVFDIIQHGGPGAQKQLEKLLGIHIRDKHFSIHAHDATRPVLDGIKAAINAVHGKTVTIATRWVNFGKQAGQAAGALLGRASGGNAVEWGGGNQELWEKQQRAMDIAAARGPSQKRYGKFNRPTLLVGEEDRSEIVISTNPKYRKSNIRYLAEAARELGVTFVDAAAPGRGVTAAKKKKPPKPSAYLGYTSSNYETPYGAGNVGNPSHVTGEDIAGTGVSGSQQAFAGQVSVDMARKMRERAEAVSTKQHALATKEHQLYLKWKQKWNDTAQAITDLNHKTSRQKGGATKADWAKFHRLVRQQKRQYNKALGFSSFESQVTHGGVWKGTRYMSMSTVDNLVHSLKANEAELGKWYEQRTHWEDVASAAGHNADTFSGRYSRTGDSQWLTKYHEEMKKRDDAFVLIRKMDKKAFDDATKNYQKLKGRDLKKLVDQLSNDLAGADADLETTDVLTDDPTFVGPSAPTLDTFLGTHGVLDSTGYRTLAEEKGALERAYAQTRIGDDSKTPATYADNEAAAQQLETFWQGVYSNLVTSGAPDSMVAAAADAYSGAQQTTKSEHENATATTDLGMSVGLQTTAADTERQNVLAQYGSNIQGLQGLNPLSDPAGRGMGWAQMNAAMLTPDYGMLGGGSGISTRGAGVNAGSGGGTVHLTNHFGAPPPDPHTWSQGVKFEIGAIL